MTRLSQDADLGESLRPVAVAGCDLLASCASSSVTIITAQRPRTVAATSSVSADLDEIQYDHGDGPCLTAAREQKLVVLDMSAARAAWAPFREAARARGVTGSISVPLLLNDVAAYGAYNAYSTTTATVREGEVQIAQRFAAHASILVDNALAYWAARDLGRNLTKALEHRGVIEQAKGILMSARRCKADEAFEVLRARSQAENRKLRDVAADIVATTQH